MVDILLATCNGEKYIAEQLNSLMSQTCQDFRVLASDDASTDATRAILESYRPFFEGRLEIISYGGARLGAAANFGHLMLRSLQDECATWMMFCDQDDVWLPNKLELFLKMADEIDVDPASGQMPCAIYSDLRIVSSRMEAISNSFFAYSNTSPILKEPLGLFSMNVMTGCALMVNRALMRLAVPLPAHVVMHDWWCALLSMGGRSIFIPEPLTLYRQHEANQIGAKRRGFRSSVLRLLKDPLSLIRKLMNLGHQTYRQACALEERLESHGQNVAHVRRYLAWRRKRLWARLLSYRQIYPGSELDRLSRCLFWGRTPCSA